MSDTTTSATPASLVSLEGRVALVTGAAGGIGSAVGRLFRSAGARVLDSDLSEAERSDFLPCDLRDAEAIRRMVEAIAADAGRLDILVHCAGITRDAVLWKMDPDDWSDTLTVNLDSAFHLLRFAAPLLRKSDGAAVALVASINGERGKFGQANYAASKGGLIALGKTAARELGRFGVRVNSVAPGFIETPMTEMLPEDVAHRAREESLLGRVGRPEDVANACLYLCSDLGRHVTGSVLRVDGGQYIA